MAFPEVGDCRDSKTVLQRADVQLTVVAAALRGMDVLRRAPCLCRNAAERLAVVVVRVDERLVELKPDALTLGSPNQANRARDY